MKTQTAVSHPAATCPSIIPDGPGRSGPDGTGNRASLVRAATLAAITLMALGSDLNRAQAEDEVRLQFTPIDVPGGSAPGAYGINNRGAIVGSYLPDGQVNAAWPGFILQHGLVTKVNIPADVIGAPAPNDFGWAGALNGINDAGTAVGIYEDFNYQVHGFLRSADGQICYLPDATTGSRPWTVFGRINNRAVIAGWAAPNGWNPGISPIRGFLMINGRYSLFDFPGTSFTQAWGLNDQNDVVGDYLDAAGVWHGFVRHGKEYRTLDFPGSTSTFANDINNRGQIVGFYVDLDGQSHGFLLSDRVFTTVDFPGAVGNDVSSINDHGQMVGDYGNYTGAYLATIVPRKGSRKD